MPLWLGSQQKDDAVGLEGRGASGILPSALTHQVTGKFEDIKRSRSSVGKDEDQPRLPQFPIITSNEHDTYVIHSQVEGDGICSGDFYGNQNNLSTICRIWQWR